MRAFILAMTLASFGVACTPAVASISPATVVDGPGPDIRNVGAVAMAEDGTGGVVYTKAVDGRDHVFVSRFVDGTWSAPQRVDTGPSQRFASSWPAIGAGDDGRLVVVWVQEFGPIDRMYSAALQPGSTQFEDPIPVDLAVGDSSQGIHPQVAMSAGGLAYVIYRVVTDPVAATAPPGNVYGEYRAARFGGQYWSGIGTTLNRNPASAMPAPTSFNRPRIGIDRIGNAVAAWQELDDDFVPRVYSRRIFPAGVGIARQVTPARIGGKPVSGAADQFDLSVGVNGEAAVAWRQNPSTRSGFKRRRAFVSLLGDVYSFTASTFGVPTAVDGGGADGPASGVDGVSVSVAGPTARVTFGSGDRSTNTVTAYDGASDDVEQIDDGSMLLAPSYPFGLVTADGAAAWAWTRSSSGRNSLTVAERTADGDDSVRSLYSSATGPVEGVSFAGARFGDALVAFAQGRGTRRMIAAGYVDAPPGGVAVQVPMGFVRGNTVPLAWDQAFHGIGTITYSVEVDGDVVAEGLRRTSYGLPVAGLVNGRHSVSILTVDSGGQTTEGPSSSFTVDRAAPRAAVAVAGRRVTVRISDLPVAGGSGLDASRSTVAFGDGSTTQGSAVAVHGYASPGRYLVSVSAADRVGNATRVTREVLVR